MTGEDEAILDAWRSRRSFETTEVVYGVDISIARGEIVALTGANNNASSALIPILSRHLQSDKGEIVFQGEDVTTYPALHRAQLGFDRVFDMSNLFDHLTDGDHILPVARDNAPTSSDLYAQWQVEGEYLGRDLRSLGLAGLDVAITTQVTDLSVTLKRRLAFGNPSGISSSMRAAVL